MPRRLGTMLVALTSTFLLFDATCKILQVPAVLDICRSLEVPVRLVPAVGCLLAAATILYIVPRTRFVGAVLLTGYLGGAVWTHLRLGGPIFPIVFPFIIGSIAWMGAALRDARLMTLIVGTPDSTLMRRATAPSIPIDRTLKEAADGMKLFRPTGHDDTATDRRIGTDARACEDVLNDEAVLRSLADEWSRGLESRDLDRMTAAYSPDIHLYDCKPPYQIRGVSEYRANWEACWPYFPAQMQSEHHDLKITAGSDVAFAYGLHRIKPINEESQIGQTWLRATVCYRKVGGKWQVAHEHVSLPFDPMTEQVAYIPHPDTQTQSIS